MLKRIFIAGLAAAVPIIITIYVITGLFSFADGILGKLINKTLQEQVGYKIPGLGIILAVLIIFILGILLRFSRTRLFKFLERMFFGIPLVNKIYFPVKRIVYFIFFPPQKRFKSAVLVEYPRRGIYSIGLITNKSYPPLEKKTGREMCNVFIPSSPSPLTGFTLIVPKEDLIFLEIGIDEAIRLVVSGGLINPGENKLA